MPETFRTPPRQSNSTFNFFINVKIRDRPKTGFTFSAVNENGAENDMSFWVQNRNETENQPSFSAENENEKRNINYVK